MFIDIHASLAHTNWEQGIWNEVINTDHVMSMTLDSGRFAINFVNGYSRIIEFDINHRNMGSLYQVYNAIKEAMAKGINCSLVLYP